MGLHSRLVGGIEDIQQLLKDKFNYVNCRPAELYQAMADEAYRTYLASESRDVVYLDVNIDNQTTGRLLIELYSDKCPKTSYNFKCLCTGKNVNLNKQFRFSFECQLIGVEKLNSKNLNKSFKLKLLCKF